MRTGMRVALALCVAALAGESAAAGGVELQLGRSYMDRAGAMAVFVEGVLPERYLGHGRFSWSPDVAVGLRFRYGEGGDWSHRFFFSFQSALHTGRTQALSSALEFVSTLGWQGERFSVQLRHISNGSIHQPNRGETLALLGMRIVW